MSLAVIARNLAESSATAPERLKYLKDGNKIALYGAGAMGRDVLRALTEWGVAVWCFLDRNAMPGQTVEGYPVLRPDDDVILQHRAAAHLIVCIFNPTTDLGSLYRKLMSDGWHSVTSAVQLYQLFPGLRPQLALDSAECYVGKADEILSVQDLWSDEKSRRFYEALVEFRVTGDYGLLDPPDSLQYFPSDVPPWKTPLRLIDCGAYDGDTLRVLWQLKLPVEAVMAFEPDPVNYSALIAQRDAGQFDYMEISLWPCGVYSRAAQLRFSAGLGVGSRISEEGTEVTQCVALDDCVGRFRPTLVKMDIEGGEYDALMGAVRTIKEYRPGLTVCLYHRPDDLWRIPALIRSWDLGYKFYLRGHACNGYELILYAIQ